MLRTEIKAQNDGRWFVAMAELLNDDRSPIYRTISGIKCPAVVRQYGPTAAEAERKVRRDLDLLEVQLS